jgi:hypothetical protein
MVCFMVFPFDKSYTMITKPRPKSNRSVSFYPSNSSYAVGYGPIGLLLDAVGIVFDSAGRSVPENYRFQLSRKPAGTPALLFSPAFHARRPERPITKRAHTNAEPMTQEVKSDQHLVLPLTESVHKVKRFYGGHSNCFDSGIIFLGGNVIVSIL